MTKTDGRYAYHSLESEAYRASLAVEHEPEPMPFWEDAWECSHGHMNCSRH